MGCFYPPLTLKSFFAFSSDIIQGEFGKDLEKFQNEDPRLVQLLVKHKEVFGELPPPQKGQTLVQLDLQIEKEFEGMPLKSKCWPMPKPDQEEIENQANEMVRAGLAEEYTGKDFPKFCSPTMLVEKEKNKEVKTSKSRRMCVDYRKLNKRTMLHVGSLPNLEDNVEILSQFRFKCKLDMRSGFWQVSLTPQAQDFCAFIIPSGRVFKPLVMPFGLSNAPPIFQELMEKVIAEVKRRPPVKALVEPQRGHLNAFFDDTGIGANKVEDVLTILGNFLEVCKQHNLRVKLNKCEFLREEMEYLGFLVGYGWWKPSPKKVEALKSFQVKDLKSLRAFLGAGNFLRRLVKKTTPFPAPPSPTSPRPTKNGSGDPLKKKLC